MSVRKAMIVGAGLMGSGIAQVCAQAGIEVMITDAAQQALGKAMKNIAWSLGKLVEKGRLLEDAETIVKRIRVARGFEDAAEAEIVIEAVFEKIEVKHEVFRQISRP